MAQDPGVTMNEQQYHLSEQLLQQIAVEAAFPMCARSRLWEGYERQNAKVLEGLRDEGGFMWKGAGVGVPWLSTGSKAEGLAMGDRWGHGMADLDVMELHGGDLEVLVPRTCMTYPGSGALPTSEQPTSPTVREVHHCLIYRPEECPGAYCKLEVTHNGMLLQRLVGSLGISTAAAQRCIINQHNRHWLHAQNLLLAMTSDKEGIAGPAGQEYKGMVERVPAFVSSGPHPGMDDFRNRARKGWPSAKLISCLMAYPMLLVLVGHKFSPESDLQARISWSSLELLISHELPPWVIQGYIAFKYSLKNYLRTASRSASSCTDGRGRVGSYHLKTLLYHHLEGHPPSNVRSPFGLFIELAEALRRCLSAGRLQHYFLPGCDLLETVPDTERRSALGAVDQVLADPIEAILTSPMEPSQLYGDVSPGELLRCVKNVSSPPRCERSRGQLRDRLGRLDACRQGRYQEQCERDADFSVDGRPQVISLLDLIGVVSQH